MANTYSQLYIQFVFSVKGRENLIQESFRDELEKIMYSIVSSSKSKALAIYCNPDHTHILVSLHPSISPSKLMEQVKSGSSNWINKKKLVLGKFAWQDGYGAFSYTKNVIDHVIKYIFEQREHHKKQTFRDEYLDLLKTLDISHEERYLFEWYDK